MPELNTLDYTNIIAIVVVLFIIFGLGRVLINFTRSLFRMGCLIVLVGAGIYAMWLFLQV